MSENKKKKQRNTKPRCNEYLDCRANNQGYCEALNDNNFGNKKCPFYKSRR